MYGVVSVRPFLHICGFLRRGQVRITMSFVHISCSLPVRYTVEFHHEYHRTSRIFLTVRIDGVT